MKKLTYKEQRIICRAVKNNIQLHSVLSLIFVSPRLSSKLWVWQSLNCVPSALPVRWCWAAEPMLMFSEQDAPPSQHIDEKRTWEKRGKDHFSSSALLLAESQGQAAKVVLFTFLTWGWGRKEGMGGGGCWVRASAGPPGTPLPGGTKSMWFLSYLWEGWSTASNTDIQWASKKSEHWEWKHFDSSPTVHLIYSLSLSCRIWVCVCVCVYLCRWTHANFTAAKGEVTSEVKSIHHSEKRCHIKKMLFHGGL